MTKPFSYRCTLLKVQRILNLKSKRCLEAPDQAFEDQEGSKEEGSKEVVEVIEEEEEVLEGHQETITPEEDDVIKISK